jgi:manganese efflux pump family protein
MLALALVAVSVGFSNLAASIGLGTGGVSAATRLRVAITFGLFEAGMPILGLLIGTDLASSIGRDAKWVGAILLVGVGCYGIITFARKWGLGDSVARWRTPPGGTATGDRALGAAPEPATSAAGSDAGAVTTARRREGREWIKVAISGFALSLDNLIAGFALGSYQVNLMTGALVFGAVSIAMSLAGLEFGARLGNWAGDSGELIGGVVLVGVGLAIGFGLLG